MPRLQPNHPPATDRRAAARHRTRIRRKLLAWYDAYRRDLPWRNTSDPYAIWLSETMLQQTQVATVIPYYDRFLRRYPTVDCLAAAPLDDVLHLWAGLGYYSRARNLHRAAIEITNRYNGQLPDSVESLRTLPGVGRYTAGAVASIAFDRPAPVVDGNVARVLARLFEINENIRSPAGDRSIWAHAESLLAKKRPGDFNQALMELGATVCRPGDAAQCLTCPLRSECGAATSDTVGHYPVRKKKTPVKKETHVVLVVDRAGRRLYRRRAADGLWGGLWELPSAVRNGRSDYVTAKTLARSLFGDAARVHRQPVGELDHQLTHRSVHFIAFCADVSVAKVDSPPDAAARWLTERDAEKLGLSTAMRRLIASIPKNAAIANGRATTQRR